ncbi:MAG: 4-hydroxy-3-methylbut-2-enyl diphosphate reductase [Spirochaetota bacterium]|nr:4-hydroxy-3-methylbut-2-enyl diphosphate reductase [Spirochaetota bacterium]
MKIDIARHSGFCMGVRNAVIKAVDIINNSPEEIYIDGPLIHNPQTVEILKNRGLVLLENPEDIDNRIIAVRAHGITKQRLDDINKRSKSFINLTCKKVAYVQGIVKKFSLKGYHILILGDDNHAEVLSIKSHASNGVTVLSSLETIDNIPPANKYLLVAQTTLDINYFNKAVDKLKKQIENIEIINTICSATRDRQNDLHKAIQKGVDSIVVVGGRNSANTKRLAEIGRQNNIRVYHIETEKELNPEDFSSVKHLLITAGTSTPAWIINNCLEKLYEIKYRTISKLLSILKSFIEFIIRTNIFSALMSIFFTAAISRCSILDCKKPSLILSVSFIFLMYSVNNFFQSKIIMLSNPFKFDLYNRSKVILSFLTVLSFGVFIYSSFLTDIHIQILYIFSLVFGILYALPWIKKLVGLIDIRLLHILFNAKSLISSLGWSVVILFIPYISEPYEINIFLPLFVICSSIIIVRNVLLDLVGYHGDLLLGVETIPTVFGIKFTKSIFITLSVLFTASIVYNTYSVSFFNLLYLLNMIYYYWIYNKIKHNEFYYRLKFEVLIDLNFIFFAVFNFFNVLCRI